MHPRLIVISGKGGVGKTTFSLALAKSLINKNKKVFYNSFNNEVSPEIVKAQDIPHLQLDLHESAEIYIGRKLKSKTIASWIMKTTFFQALLNILPALGQMIFLGHIIDMLEKDEDLHIVIDSPASGHAVSMFESTQHFKDIFKVGLIVDDIMRMKNFISNPKLFKAFIVSLPTELSLQEASELSDSLSQIGIPNIEIILNGIYSKNQTVKDNYASLPTFLQNKIENEKKLIHESSRYIEHIASNDFANIVRSITETAGETIG